MRLLHDERERRQHGDAEEAGHLPVWALEAFCAPGREAVYKRWEARNLEEKLLHRGHRGKTGAGEIKDLLYDQIGGIRGEGGAYLGSRERFSLPFCEDRRDERRASGGNDLCENRLVVQQPETQRMAISMSPCARHDCIHI